MVEWFALLLHSKKVLTPPAGWFTNKTNLQRSEKFETSVWSASQPIFTRIPNFTLNEYPVALGDVDLSSSICQVSSLNIA